MTMTKNSLIAVPSVDVLDSDFETETTYFRVSSTICNPSDATTADQMHIVEAAGTLEFWDDPSEDIYKESDGDAV